MNRTFRSFLNTNLTLRSGAAAALATLTFVSASAMAQSKFGYQPPTSPGAISGFSIQGTGGFGGSAGGHVLKGVGEVKVGSTGFAQLESTLDVATNGCPGGCGQTTAGFKGAVGQQTIIEGLASGHKGAWLNTNGAATVNLGVKFAAP